MSTGFHLSAERFGDAEAALSGSLANVAAGLSRLDERIAWTGDALLADLAEHEVVDLLWAQGDMLAHDRLLLWNHAGLGQGQLILRAAWAVRRLSGPVPVVDPMDDVGRLRDFLDLAAPETLDPALTRFRRRTDPLRWSDEAAGYLADHQAARGLHPLTQACMAYLGWHWRELGEPGDVLEAGVLAARTAARGQAHARFLPILQGNRLALSGIGRVASPRAQLAQFLESTQGALGRALGRLARIRDWRRRACETAARLPGRLPRQAVQLLGEVPLVSANLLRDRLGVSQQAANGTLRNLSRAGLIEEVSGQSRYRVWRARL